MPSTWRERSCLKIKVAWFSPLPPQRSGIAEYCADILPFLREYMDIELFVEEPDAHRGTPLARLFPVLDYRAFPDRRRNAHYDLCIYQMGNDIVHRFVYMTLVEYPGLVVLHEPMLHHLMLQMMSAGWSDREYSRELDYNYGVDRGDVEGVIFADATEISRFSYPMLQRVVDSSLGILVHSHYACREMLKLNPRGPVGVVRQAYVPVPEVVGLSQPEARRMLGLDPGDFIIGTFGFITPNKRIETILDALEEVLPDVPSTCLVLVGGKIDEYPIDSIISERGLTGRVIVTGYLELEEMTRYMVACDLAVALRKPSAGETSSSVVRLLGLGCPTIVSNTMAYAEFDDDICMKIDPANETEELVSCLRNCHQDREFLLSLGNRARESITREYSVEEVATEYYDFTMALLLARFGRYLAETGSGSMALARERLVAEVAECLHQIGVGPHFWGVLQGVSEAVDGVIPPAKEGS